MHEVRSGKLRRNFKVPRAGKIVRYNRGTLKVACVASVSVRFRNKERGTKVKDRAKMAQVKELGGGGVGWGRKEGKFLPLLLPSLSFFGSRFISREAKTENPVPRLSLLPNQTETLATQATLRALYDFWLVYKVDNQGPVSRKA